MLLNNRVIWKDNATLIDLSVPLSDYLTTSPSTIGYTAFEDAIYIGSDLPFNHRWFEIGTANTNASVTSISVWNGETWKNAVDVIDQTAVGGKAFAQSGYISWTPDREESWDIEQTTEDISELSTLKIYDLFWVKITFSGSFSASTSLKYVGHKFSTDTDLFARYSGLANSDLLTGFKAGKTNWTDQHFIAAEELIEHLRANRTVVSPNQILRWQQFKTAAVHKCAEVIYRSFGADYVDERKDASIAFTAAMKVGDQNLDRNANARLEFSEKKSATEFMDR